MSPPRPQATINIDEVSSGEECVEAEPQEEMDDEAGDDAQVQVRGTQPFLCFFHLIITL
jgi:hypothetical protein